MFAELIEPVFVFGSNEAGRHGKGAALEAVREYGAIYGQGFGYQGNSFAIPTKDGNLRKLPTDRIAGYVAMFLEFAISRPDLIFKVTPIGCGLAGYEPRDIAWMFDAPCPRNVILPDVFKAVLGHV